MIGYGVLPFPDFWLAPLENGDGFRASHIAFSALNRESVRAFFAADLGAGTEVLHEPRVWAEYHENRGVHFGAVGLVDMPDRPWSGASHCPRWRPLHENYSGAFVRAPDGVDNVEAVCHTPE